MEDSRKVALDVLVACLDKGQPLDDALARHPGFPALDPRDRAFVRLLARQAAREWRSETGSAAANAPAADPKAPRATEPDDGQ